MKRVLCFGESNMWGFIPKPEVSKGERYPEDVRWTGVAQKELGDEYQLIVEGLNGRTTVWEDPVRPYMNAFTYLSPCLLSQFPLDAVVIYLGTNDLKQRFNKNAWAIAEGMKCLVEETIRLSKDFNGSVPKILIISPVYLHEKLDTSPYAGEFEGELSVKKSKELAPEYERVAREHGCYFLDAAKFGEASDKDSIHMMPESHKAIGEAVAKKIREMI